MMRYGLLFSVLFGWVLSGCVSPTLTPEETKWNQLLAAVYAYQFEHNLSNLQWNADYFYLQYAKQNPPEDVFRILDDCPVKLRRYTQCKLPSDYTDFVNLRDVDNRKKNGVLFRIDRVDYGTDTACVYGGYYEGVMSSSHEVYDFVYTDSVWTLQKAKVKSFR